MRYILILLTNFLFAITQEVSQETLRLAYNKEHDCITVFKVEENSDRYVAKFTTKKYFKKEGDGFVFKRIENESLLKSGVKFSLTEIVNRNGYWFLKGNPVKSILNSKYEISKQKINDKIYGENSKDDLFWFLSKDVLVSQNTEILNGKSIQKINLILNSVAYEEFLKIKSLEDEEIFSNQREVTKKHFEKKYSIKNSEKVILVETRTPYKCDIYYDKESNSIIKNSIFNKNGELISSSVVLSIQYNIPLSHDLFQIPNTPKSIVIQNYQDELEN